VVIGIPLIEDHIFCASIFSFAALKINFNSHLIQYNQNNICKAQKDNRMQHPNQHYRGRPGPPPPTGHYPPQQQGWGGPPPPHQGGQPPPPPQQGIFRERKDSGTPKSSSSGYPPSSRGPPPQGELILHEDFD